MSRRYIITHCKPYVKFILNQNTTFTFNIFVDVSATAAALYRTTVRQVSLERTVSNHGYVAVGRTPGLCSSNSFEHTTSHCYLLVLDDDELCSFRFICPYLTSV